MTIDDQLRDITRRADQHQQVITAKEIVRRASGSYLAPERRRGRHWVLAAAAAYRRGRARAARGERRRIAPTTSDPGKVPSTSPATPSPTFSERLDRLRR